MAKLSFWLLGNKLGDGLVTLNEKKYPLILSWSKILKRLQINCIFLYCFRKMQTISNQKIKDLPLNRTTVLIKQNDTATLKELYKANFTKVKRYVLKNSGDEQQAKDVYQEAFVAMWRNIKDDKFSAESETAINGYLFQIAKYKWLDHIRSVKYKNTTFINREIEYNEPDTDENEVQNRKIKLIMDSIDQLGERCQLLMKLFYFERKSFKEISELMAMDEASARNAKYRCQEQLKKMTQNIPNGFK
jgi:RNA polymerase sigma factor (sigma-70 family)